MAETEVGDELAGRAPGVRHHVRVSSRYGHDAFLKEVDIVADAIRFGLGDGEVAR